MRLLEKEKVLATEGVTNTRYYRALYSKGFQGVCLRLLEKEKVLATEGVTNTRYYRASKIAVLHERRFFLIY
ncbi:hypothetical protein ACWY2R_08665 [Enterococcus avium]